MKELLSVEPVPDTSVKVWLSPGSASVAVRVPTVDAAGSFSAMLALLSAMSVGAWLTTTNAVSPLVQSDGSVTRRRTRPVVRFTQKYAGVFDGIVIIVPDAFVQSRCGTKRTDPSGWTQTATGDVTENVTSVPCLLGHSAGLAT